jgi:ribosomal protein S25
LLEDEPYNGRPSTSLNTETISKVKNPVPVDQQITIIEIANEVGIPFGAAQSILTEELWMKWVCAKAVLRLLTDAQRDCWKTVASELCET